MLIDLHGFSTPLARASIRSALYKLRDKYHSKGDSEARIKNLVIITGIGRNSREWLEPVLKPSVQNWLENEFVPPLRSEELAENPGRILISGSDIREWSKMQIYNTTNIT